MKQYFFLVMKQCSKNSVPVKISLQELDAEKYGRRMATKETDSNVSYSLYRQEITRTSVCEFVKILTPYIN